MVATLARRVGVQHVEAVEDAVQSSLMKALEAWTTGSMPDKPSAWLFRVAYNDLMAELRQRSSHLRILEHYSQDNASAAENAPDTLMAGEVQDDLLRMLFVCSDPTIPPDSQLVLALKTLCGFSIREIAIRLFTSDANVYKRLARARGQLRHQSGYFKELADEQYDQRLTAVNRSLYVLFTEGHLSSHIGMAVRRELCSEAIRLTTLLAKHPVGQFPETFALLALMHLHMARMNARLDGSGGLLLLEEQDRSLWDRSKIQTGMEWLEKSAQGNSFSRYHSEAGIAAEHCLAPTLQATRWDKVVACYSQLEDVAPSPIHKLNRAVAVAEWQGPAAGLAILKDYHAPAWLTGSYLWAAVLADLNCRCKNIHAARRYREKAFEMAPTPEIRKLLERRLWNSEQQVKE